MIKYDLFVGIFQLLLCIIIISPFYIFPLDSQLCEKKKNQINII